MPHPTVVPALGDEPAGPEIIEKAITELAAGMKRLNSTRLKRETIITLLADNSRVSKTQIRLVLDSLDSLEETFLKPAKMAGR